MKTPAGEVIVLPVTEDAFFCCIMVKEYLVMFEACWAKPFIYVTRFAINLQIL